jgi:hypothetical protein
MKPRLWVPIFGTATTLVLREIKLLDFEPRFSLCVSKTQPSFSSGLNHQYNMMARMGRTLDGSPSTFVIG